MFLFFTRSNGDIDCMPEDSVNDQGLTTVAKKKAFIGDSGATNFSLQEPVKYAKWDADSKSYISNPVGLKEDQRKSLKVVRDKALAESTVEFNGDVYQVRDL